MIYIRTDANETIATGHMMRCISIAKQLMFHNIEATFLLSDMESTRLLENIGIPYQILHTDWANLDSEEEFKALIPILKGELSPKKPVLLVDSYTVTNGYFLRLKEYAKLIYIDDLFVGVYDVDMLINYTIYYKLFDYKYAYQGKNTRLLLGTEYTPLREQFQRLNNSKKEIKEANDIFEILVMCGGGDPFHVLGDILAYGEKSGFIKKDNYHIVAGAYHPQIELLKTWERNYDNIYLHQNVTDMATLMQQCDIAVSAAGTTLYECCAVSLPTIFFCMVDNQQYDGLCFSRDSAMLYAGDLRFQKEQCIKNIFSHISYLKLNAGARKIMREKMRYLVDGNGAKRIAEEIEKLWEED